VELPLAGLEEDGRGGDWAVVVTGLGKVYLGEDAAHVLTDRAVTAADVWAVVDAVLAGRPVDPDQRRWIGCGIKWR
jgi:hypothetical protein